MDNAYLKTSVFISPLPFPLSFSPLSPFPFPYSPFPFPHSPFPFPLSFSPLSPFSISPFHVQLAFISVSNGYSVAHKFRVR